MLYVLFFQSLNGVAFSQKSLRLVAQSLLLRCLWVPERHDVISRPMNEDVLHLACQFIRAERVTWNARLQGEYSSLRIVAGQHVHRYGHLCLAARAVRHDILASSDSLLRIPQF